MHLDEIPSALDHMAAILLELFLRKSAPGMPSHHES